MMTDGLTPDERAILRHLEGRGSDTALEMARAYRMTIPATYVALNGLERQRLVEGTANGRWLRRPTR